MHRLRRAKVRIEYGVPKAADLAEPFVSRVRARVAGRTAELGLLAIEMLARCSLLSRMGPGRGERLGWRLISDGDGARPSVWGY